MAVKVGSGRGAHWRGAVAQGDASDMQPGMEDGEAGPGSSGKDHGGSGGPPGQPFCFRSGARLRTSRRRSSVSEGGEQAGLGHAGPSQPGTAPNTGLLPGPQAHLQTASMQQPDSACMPMSVSMCTSSSLKRPRALFESGSLNRPYFGSDTGAQGGQHPSSLTGGATAMVTGTGAKPPSHRWGGAPPAALPMALPLDTVSLSRDVTPVAGAEAPGGLGMSLQPNASAPMSVDGPTASRQMQAIEEQPSVSGMQQIRGRRSRFGSFDAADAQHVQLMMHAQQAHGAQGMMQQHHQAYPGHPMLGQAAGGHMHSGGHQPQQQQHWLDQFNSGSLLPRFLGCGGLPQVLEEGESPLAGGAAAGQLACGAIGAAGGGLEGRGSGQQEAPCVHQLPQQGQLPHGTSPAPSGSAAGSAAESAASAGGDGGGVSAPAPHSRLRGQDLHRQCLLRQAAGLAAGVPSGCGTAAAQAAEGGHHEHGTELQAALDEGEEQGEEDEAEEIGSEAEPVGGEEEEDLAYEEHDEEEEEGGEQRFQPR